MRFLFDENLSAHLPAAVEDCFPGSVHVREVGLKSAPDSAVWEYAAAHGYSVVTKDADLRQLSFLYGHPPKVIWLRVGNCPTRRIEALLRRRVTELAEFVADEGRAFMALS